MIAAVPMMGLKNDAGPSVHIQGINRRSHRTPLYTNTGSLRGGLPLHDSLGSRLVSIVAQPAKLKNAINKTIDFIR